MTTKDSNIVSWYVDQLRAACLSWNDAVTAGQVAQRMGVARSTAKKYLEMAVKEGRAQRCIGVHVNHQQKTGYVPNGAW